jgi:hypothetical protein
MRILIKLKAELTTIKRITRSFLDLLVFHLSRTAVLSSFSFLVNMVSVDSVKGKLVPGGLPYLGSLELGQNNRFLQTEKHRAMLENHGDEQKVLSTLVCVVR